jgi:tRNA threonylcarbamoyl adenosine modification protein YeaZ
MLLLLDTSTRTAVVALAGPGGEDLLGERIYPPGEGGSALLLAGALALLEEQGSGLEALTGVVVNRGPGSYTGLRIGYALAQGLAETRGLPIAGIASFQAFADEHQIKGQALLVCFDARSRGIAWICYPPGREHPEESGEENEGLRPEGHREELAWEGRRIVVRFAPPEALPGLAPRPGRVTGPGVVRLAGALESVPHGDLVLVAGTDRPSPATLLRRGARRIAEGGEDPEQVEPLYLGTVVPPVRGA